MFDVVEAWRLKCGHWEWQSTHMAAHMASLDYSPGDWVFCFQCRISRQVLAQYEVVPWRARA